MLKLFAAHKGSRLIFAILTLSIALAGVVANYSLSHNAMRAFQSQLELKESAQFLISGRLADIPDASERAYDAGSFERRQVEIFDALLPPSVAVYRIRVRQSEILTETGPRPIKLVEASRDFLISQSAEPAPGLDWDKRTGLCAVGQSLTERLPETKAPELSLDGRICQVTAILSLKETPPFIGLSDAVFIPKGIAEMATDISLSWNVFLEDPSGALSEASLRTTLSHVLDLSYLNIWSGAAIAERAERLIHIVRLVSNGLGFVILLVGSASIASLMSFSVAERAREIAVKRTIGASKPQIISEIIWEALVIGFVSAVIGVIAGYHLALYLQEPLGEFLAVGLRDGEQLSPWPIVRTAGAFLAICGLAGAVPGWHAASSDPATVLRAP